MSRHVPRWQVMDEGDAAAHHFLVKALAEARPDDAILSEEGRDSPNRLAHNRVWIVDPLDGTNEFGEDGRNEWAVHVALVARRHADRRRRRPAGGRDHPRHRAAAGAARPPRRAAPGRHQPLARAVRGGDDRRGRSAPRCSGWAAPARRRWPSCSATPTSTPTPAACTSGTRRRRPPSPPPPGCHVSRLDGSPLVYNQRDPWLPDLLVCRPELAGPALDALWG